MSYIEATSVHSTSRTLPNFYLVNPQPLLIDFFLTTGLTIAPPWFWPTLDKLNCTKIKIIWNKLIYHFCTRNTWKVCAYMYVMTSALFWATNKPKQWWNSQRREYVVISSKRNRHSTEIKCQVKLTSKYEMFHKDNRMVRIQIAAELAN